MFKAKVKGNFGYFQGSNNPSASKLWPTKVWKFSFANSIWLQIFGLALKCLFLCFLEECKNWNWRLSFYDWKSDFSYVELYWYIKCKTLKQGTNNLKTCNQKPDSRNINKKINVNSKLTHMWLPALRMAYGSCTTATMNPVVYSLLWLLECLDLLKPVLS